MPAPVMWDATVDKRSGEHTHQAKVGMKVVQEGRVGRPGGHPGRGVPRRPGDRSTRSPSTPPPPRCRTSSTPTCSRARRSTGPTDTELDLGNPGTTNADGTPRTAQSFISWNTTPIQDALVLDAKLCLWNFHSGNTDCKAYPWEVWSSPAASTSSRWTNRPTMTAKKATSTETRGNAGCTTQPDGWINADVTTLVQEWASAKATRGHMGLRATDESRRGAVEAGQLRQRRLQPAEAGGELQLPAAYRHQAGGRPAVLLLQRRLHGQHHDPDAAGHLRRRRRRQGQRHLPDLRHRHRHPGRRLSRVQVRAVRAGRLGDRARRRADQRQDVQVPHRRPTTARTTTPAGRRGRRSPSTPRAPSAPTKVTSTDYPAASGSRARARPVPSPSPRPARTTTGWSGRWTA